MTIVIWRGHILEIPSNPQKWPVKAVEAFEEQRWVNFFMTILGNQWYGIESELRTMEDLNDFANAWVARI